MIASTYLPILIFIGCAICFGILLVSIGRLLGRSSPNVSKISAYECGFPADGDAHMRFNTGYYLIAIIFILFDLEIAFLFPWAVVFRALSWYGLYIILIFLLILTIGFIYVWRKGALEWD